MRYRTLSLQCHCGQPSSRIREIGFTADRQLVVHWRCSECKSYVYGVKPLDDCYQICPTPEELGETGEELDAAVQKTDTEFLQKLGVKFPEDEVSGTV